MSATEGTGLRFFAPTPHAARPPLAAAASPAPAPLAHRILLVEDDSTVLQFSTLVLVRGGYQVTAVEGCEAAWQAIQSGSYDLLVTDNRMPGMSGLELVTKLRSAQIALPVIVASGGVEAEGFAQNQSLQPVIALPKPFTAKQLLETVAEALRRAVRDPPPTEVSFRAYADSNRHRGINE
jgi:two-component system response regulator GlrR